MRGPTVAQPRRNVGTKNAIYARLRRSIVMGRREPGQRLSLQNLAKSFGASITPVRDALQMLHQEGLVTIKPRSGYFVTRLTLKQLVDLLDLREILEVAAVGRAASCITDAQVAALEQVHSGYTGDDEESVERYISENRRLHCLIAEMSGNRELAAMIGHVHDRLACFLVASHAGQSMLDFTHDRLLVALRANDVAQAQQAMRDDLKEMRETTLECVIREESEFWHLGNHA